MTAITNQKIAVIDTDRFGIEVRTYESIKDLLTDTMLNRGEEIAMWAETEAKRCADIWRNEQQLPLTVPADIGEY